MIYEDLHEAVEFIRTKCQLKPRIGVVLGSGMGFLSEVLHQEWAGDYANIPHFGSPSVAGHRGRLILGHLDQIPVALLQGRLHYYEGHEMNKVVLPTRVLALLGIEAIVLTNAAGGLSKKMSPGDFMVIDDHINMMGDNPLMGKNMDQIGPRFPDMTEAYDKPFADLAMKAAKKNKIRATRGVYIGLTGPTYETPAEVRHLQMIGGNAVGMSTVPEAIAANHFGLRVCGVSCITNLAAGIGKHKLSHDDITNTAKAVEVKFKAFLVDLIKMISETLDGSIKKSR